MDEDNYEDGGNAPGEGDEAPSNPGNDDSFNRPDFEEDNEPNDGFDDSGPGHDRGRGGMRGGFGGDMRGRGGNRQSGFQSNWGPDFGGPGNWRGNRGFRGGPGGPPRGFRGGPPMGPGGQFGGPRMRGRGGFGGPGPMGPNGFGPPMRGGRGFGPRGPPGPGWGGEPPFHGGPRMGGPGPRGMMHGGPWGGPPQGGWDEDDYDDMRHGHPDMNDPAGALGIDLSGEVWVETKTEEGKSYFYNARTRETTWTRPEETPGVKILTQVEVERLTQQLADGDGGKGGPQDDGSGYGMPPPSFMGGGGPPGFMPPGGGGGFGMPPPGFPPPWGMPPPGQAMPGVPPPWAGGPAPFVEPCDWSEHTSPDGKKYYYNAKTGESVWEKPKEFADYEKRTKGQAGAGAPNPVPAVSAPAKLIEAAIASATTVAAPVVIAAANGGEKVAEKGGDIVSVQEAVKPVAVTMTAASAADKSKPVSSSPVLGTPWCVVWTGDNRVFFYNPTTKTSVWERPPELVGRADVTEMMKSAAAAEKYKAKLAAGGKAGDGDSGSGSEDDDDDISGKKKKKKGGQQQQQKKPETQIIFQDEVNKQNAAAAAAANGAPGDLLKKGPIDLGKEAAMEAEVRAAKERQIVPLETRMAQFRDLLAEKEISAFSTWEKELHKIVFDPRYLLLTSKERKQVFDKYVRERAEEERREKKNRLKEKRDQFVKFMEECGLNSKTTFSEFSAKYGKDDRFKAIDKSRERESLFNEHILDLRRREKEERQAKRDQLKKDFMDLLKDSDFVDRHSSWSDVKKKIETDPRYKAIESSRDREDYFMDYVHDLKEEHRREKERKKRRSRSRSKGRSRHSRSRSHGRKSRSRSRDRDKKKKKKRSRSRDESEERRKRKKDEPEREEGEMSEEDDDYKKRDKKVHRKSETIESDHEDGGKEKADESVVSNDDNGVKSDSDGKKSDAEDVEDDADAEERAKREKEERIAASLRKREAEVAKELSGHLHARDKEREQHRHAEAVTNFQALLTDLIRQPDYSWKEARKILKKDSRYESVSSSLEKSERERIFDEHIDNLVAKKKDNFRKMLDECKAITLESSFKEIKKLIKDDPRYSRYSSSDRKCEKQFNEYMKDRLAQARMSYKQLLMETKKITDKSLQLVKDNDSGHLADIEEVLSKDRRYLDLDGFKEERHNILMDYLEEVERRGPPPPPTASEPSRRTVK